MPSTRIPHSALTDLATDILMRDTDTWGRPHELWALQVSPLGAVDAVHMELPPNANRQCPQTLFQTLSLASRMAVDIGVGLPPNLVGCALAIESWALEGEAAEERLQRHQAGEEVPDLAHHPDRIEGRVCVIGDLHGTVAMCTHRRGADTVAHDSPHQRGTGSFLDALSGYLWTLRQIREGEDA